MYAIILLTLFFVFSLGYWCGKSSEKRTEAPTPVYFIGSDVSTDFSGLKHGETITIAGREFTRV